MRTISLTNGGTAFVSNCDYAYLCRWTWHCNSGGYAARDEGNSRIPASRKRYRMHLEIAKRMGMSLTPQADHQDRNRLNNQRDNLRSAKRSEQLANRGKAKHNTSGYKGVFWHGGTQKWMAQIVVDRKAIYLGVFIKKKTAARAYNTAATKYFGNFACLNEV